jgi:hypothetical protein
MSQRSSAITLPSFGSVPAPTNSTLPPSFVTVDNVPAISSRKASLAAAVSAFSVIASLSPWRVTNEAEPPETGMAFADIGDRLG